MGNNNSTPPPQPTKKNPFYSPAVMEYVRTVGNRTTDLKDELRAETEELLPDHSIMLSASEQGSLMSFLVSISKAKKGIEVGTFTGFSSICFAEGFVDKENSKLVTLDLSEEFTAIAKKYWEKANVTKNMELILGDAVESLTTLANNEEERGTFDFAFLDGHKPQYKDYYEKCLELLKPGGWIMVDNILWSGKVVGEKDTMDESTKMLRELAEFMHQDERVEVSMLSISDGISLVYKK